MLDPVLFFLFAFWFVFLSTLVVFLTGSGCGGGCGF